MLEKRDDTQTFSLARLGALVMTGIPFVALAQDGPVKAPAGAGTGAAPAGAGWINFLLLGGMFFFMWLFIIRPQAKRQKEHKQFLEKLQAGQEVITSGGLIGRIKDVQDTIITLDVGNGTVRILKSAVSGELGKPQVAPQ
jgi:preprotein translocase subunit YajC